MDSLSTPIDDDENKMYLRNSLEKTQSKMISPKIYDLAGRRVRQPFESLATGFYIIKWKNETKKVFVQ